MTDPVEHCCNLPLKAFTIHLRCFHPESNFGVAGLGYSGDSRGYSNIPRAVGQRGKGSPPTSRVEHWVEFDLKSVTITDRGVSSDPSEWLIGGKHSYEPGSDGRMPTMEASLRNDTGPNERCRRHLIIQSHHLGYNEAVAKALRWAVPGLDLFGAFIIQVDCRARTMTITTRVTGDAFPNAEGFIVDEYGTSVFLGVHEREGTPPAMLLGTNKRFMFTSSMTIDLNSAGEFSGTLTPHTYKTVYDPGTLGTVSSGKQTVSQWNQRFLGQSPTTFQRKILDQAPPYVPDILDEIGDFLIHPLY